MRPWYQSVSLLKSQEHVINTTNTGGALDDGIEYRLHVGGRAADDAKHLGRRSLMLQRLAQFRVALAEFLKQPHVFDSDDSLVSECLKQRYLLLSERPDLRAA